MVSTVTVNNVYRDYVTNGVPGSGNHEPDKADIRALLSRLETIAGIGAVAVATKAELDAITTKDDATPGFVLGDSTATNNGQYTWDDSGSAWVKLRALPDTAAVLQSVSGTNTITASVGTGVDPAVVSLFILVAAATNTGAVTLNISGSGAQDLVDRNGDALVAGSLVSGRAYLVFDDGADYRLLNDDDRILPFQGAYAGGTTYELGDLVESGGSIWYSLQDSNTGNTPTEGAYWTQFLPGASVADGSITEAKLASNAVTSAKKSAATIAKDEGFDTIADFIADTVLTYTTSQPGTVASGDIILAGGYRLQVVASGASDNHLANANGTPVKVKVLKRNNTWPMLAFNPNADGVTDDKAKIDLVNNSGEVVDLGGKSYEYNGTFTPAATFINGSIIDDNQTRDYTVKTANDALFSAQGPRSIIRYYSATQIQIGAEKNFVMGGFRFHGKYLNGASKLFPAPALSDDCRHIISIGDGATTAGDLGAESYSSIHSWYALFACANDVDSAASFKVMPFLRVKSIAGSVITLNDAGENQRSLNTKTYQFTTNNLAGVDCLVINETLNSRGNAFSGRIASVTANTTTTVTLDDVGTMNEYDYFLPAPPGYTHYRYLGAFYRDSAEVRNIADTGTIVGSRGSQNTQGSISGALGSAVEMPCDGHVSPLATGVKFSHTDTIGSSTTGDSVVRYGMDNGSHDTDEFYYQKDAATSQSFIFNFGCVPFSFHQRLWFYTGGALNIAANTRAMNIRGWIEP